jgi:hypothetical protein
MARTRPSKPEKSAIDKAARPKSKYVAPDSLVLTLLTFQRLPQQSRFPQGCQKILLHFGEILSDNRRPRDQHQIDRFRQFILMKSKTFPQQPPRSRPNHCIANFSGGNHAQSRSRTRRQLAPIRNQTPYRQALAFLAYPRKIAALFDSRPPAEPESLWSFGGHAPSASPQTGVKRLRPTRRRLRRIALPLLLELRLRNPCWRFRRIFEG